MNNPSRPIRTRDRVQTEKKILKAAERLFAKNGFDGVSTNQLATEAGVAIGALYHHFPSKEAVYAAATKNAFARKSAVPDGLQNSEMSARERMVLIVAWFIRNIMMDKVFGPLMKREMLDPRPSTRQLSGEDLFRDQLILFKSLIGELAPAADPDKAVASMVALLFGFSNLRGLYTLFPGLEKALETPEEIADYATELLLSGLPRK